MKVLVAILVAVLLILVGFAMHPGLGILVAILSYWGVSGIYEDSLSERGKADPKKRI